MALVFQAYCIGIVWRCYKYLTLRQQAMRSTVHYILPGGGEGGERIPEPDYSSLLRDQEAAAFSGVLLKQMPPPSYQDIMLNDQPPPYPSSIVQVADADPLTEAERFAVVAEAAGGQGNNYRHCRF